ncbi:hypothetical protein [Gallaecimonas xiamenensis]|uniref:hypothetical protein n=1 Tax=Gallaecimonas xiamenensis TaxID=1207039 RepID=UPI0012EA3EE1|nr:hypothetical protein [Gallaecimonas xiamenensis]
MKFSVLLFSAIASIPCFAGQWSEATPVTKIFPHSTLNEKGTVYFSFAQVINPGSCNQSGQVALLKSNQLESEIYSLLLSAFMADKKVTYYAEGCDALGYPVMLHAAVSQ